MEDAVGTIKSKLIHIFQIKPYAVRDDAQSGSTDTHGGCAVLQVFLCFTASRRQPNVQREDPAEETMYLPTGYPHHMHLFICRIAT